MLSAEFARFPWLCAALRPRVSGFMSGCGQRFTPRNLVGSNPVGQLDQVRD
jgi:hypothetical protein